MARKTYSLRKARELRDQPTIELLDGQQYAIKSALQLSTNERLEMESLQEKMADIQEADTSEEEKLTQIFATLCTITCTILEPAPSQDLLNDMTLEDFTYLQEVFLEISRASSSTLSTGMERVKKKAAEQTTDLAEKTLTSD